MAYEPIGLVEGPHVSTHNNIELGTRYEAGSYGNTLSLDDPLDRDSRDGAQDTKGAFRSRATLVERWPSHPQRVAIMTPLRVFLVVFDAILASVPIMFISRSDPTYTH